MYFFLYEPKKLSPGGADGCNGCAAAPLLNPQAVSVDSIHRYRVVTDPVECALFEGSCGSVKMIHNLPFLRISDPASCMAAIICAVCIGFHRLLGKDLLWL